MENESRTMKIPIFILTGFLGSGKTTLLNALLEEYQDSAVIINELGDIGIDDQLIRNRNIPMQLMAGGCICCTISAELPGTLRNIMLSRASKILPAFERIIIETTGAADPANLATLILADRYLQRHCELSAIITTVDSIYGVQQIDRFPEASDQIIAADILLVTKTDIGNANTTSELQTLLARLNTSAPHYEIAHGKPPKGLLKHIHRQHCRLTGSPASIHEKMVEHLAEKLENNPRAQSLFMPSTAFTQPTNYSSGIQAASLRLPGKLNEDILTHGISQMFIRCGLSLMRFKGIFNLAGDTRPMTINYCQQRLELPSYLPAWPSDDHDSRMVLIVRHEYNDFAKKQLKELEQFLIRSSAYQVNVNASTP